MAKKSGKGTVSQRKARASVRKKSAPQKTPARAKAAATTAPARLKQAQLPTAWKLTQTAARTLWQQRRLFIGITLVYGLLNLILVQGLANSTDVSNLKNDLSRAFSGHPGSLAAGAGSFVSILSSAGNSSNQAASVYQLLLDIIASLALIWALRQVSAGLAFRIRDAYYRGMYPLVPFILVLLVIGLQLIPLIVGSALYATVTTNGVAVYFIEKLFWLLLFLVLALVSLYMLSSSLLALYIVTLPDMTPRQALRSAKELSRGRRWMILRKILYLPVVLVVIAAIITVPVIIVLTPLARWVFFVLTIFSLTAIHAYMYTLYRELLDE